jgi:hypothetical protein
MNDHHFGYITELKKPPTLLHPHWIKKMMGVKGSNLTFGIFLLLWIYD